MSAEDSGRSESRRLDWNTYCHQLVPGLLAEWGTSASRAESVGSDIALRAAAFASSGKTARMVMRAPFTEEVTEYLPRQAPRSLLAAVCVTVRCSLLEEEHSNGIVEDPGLRFFTETAAAPLSDYLNVNYNMVPEAPPAGLFSNYHLRYPRAWAALANLDRPRGAGGRSSHRPQRTVAAPLPADSEIIDVALTETGRVVMSAVDSRFDATMVSILKQIAAGELEVLFISHLSRLSRNVEKLLRIVEIVLSCDSQILTTNYLIRSHETWVRREPMISPVTDDPPAGLRNLRGISGTHRRLAEGVLAQLSE
jgi:hypothetical protein